MLVIEQLRLIRQALEAGGWVERSAGNWCLNGELTSYTLRTGYVWQEAMLAIFEDGQPGNGGEAYFYRGANPVNWVLNQADKAATSSLRKSLTSLLASA